MFKVSAWWYHNWSLLSVLDSSTGKPAEGVEVVLQVFHQVGKASVFEPIAEKYVYPVHVDVTLLLTLALHQPYRLGRSLYATLGLGYRKQNRRRAMETWSGEDLQGHIPDQTIFWTDGEEVLLSLGRCAYPNSQPSDPPSFLPFLYFSAKEGQDMVYWIKHLWGCRSRLKWRSPRNIIIFLYWLVRTRLRRTEEARVV